MSTQLMNRPRAKGRSPQTLVHRAARIASGVLLATSLACGGDSTAPETIEGTYTLQTIDGQALPAIVDQDETEKNEITAGSIKLGAGTTFTITLTLRTTIGSEVVTITDGTTGTWTRSGSTVTMRTTDGVVIPARLSANALTVGEDDGFVWVFRR